MKQPDDTSIAKALHDALQVFGMERKIKEHEILLRWEEIVGTAIANHAVPRRFSDGKLWVSVAESTWRHELSLGRIALKDKINEALGMQIVEEIVLR